METRQHVGPFISMNHIYKRFGKVVALDDVSFDLYPGEIRALVGENGAGKSTLMSILYGMYQQDCGEIFIRGEKVPGKWSPHSAIEKGIGMIHQHFTLINNHTVLENIVMPMLKWSDFLPNWKLHESKINSLLDEYHFTLNLNDKVEDITIGERQQVEILKALYLGAELLILDEPTGVLTPQQGERLLVFLSDLRKQGFSVVLVTHNLGEAMKISDNITVLRGGKNQGLLETAKTSIPEIARLMVDRDVAQLPEKQEVEINDSVLVIKDLTVETDEKKIAVDNVSFTIHKGEIVGVAGVAGNGQIELAEAVVGLKPLKYGELYFMEKEINHWDVRKRRSGGIGYISEDRSGNGMVSDMSVAENLILDCMEKKPFSINGIIQKKNIKSYSDQAITDYCIKAPDCQVPIKNLSGGNQQKVILARTLQGNPKLIVACQPTRGLDFSATLYVRKTLLQSAHDGVGILLISSDLDELFELSDRILIMYRGKIMGIVPRKQINDVGLTAIGMMMTGTQDVSMSMKKGN